MNFGAVVVVVVVEVDGEVVEVVEGADDGATAGFPPDELHAATAASRQIRARRIGRAV